MSLDAERLDRFARHIVLPEIGGAGQVALAGKHLVLVGLGWLVPRVWSVPGSSGAKCRLFCPLKEVDPSTCTFH